MFKIFLRILLVPQNIVMDLDNVMWPVLSFIDIYIYICLLQWIAMNWSCILDLTVDHCDLALLYDSRFQTFLGKFKLHWMGL